MFGSGNTNACEKPALTAACFNMDDQRSDNKRAESENVAILNIGHEPCLLFIGLEKSDQVFEHAITIPTFPSFYNFFLK